MSCRYSLVAAVLLVLSTAVPTLAQEADPLRVVPVGHTASWYELAYDAVRSVPSPIGETFPPLLAQNVISVELSLGLDPIQYAYDCGDDRCVGSASEVWLTLAPEQRQDYADRVLDALDETFPGQVRRLQIRGTGATREFRMTVLQATDGNRTYFGF